MRDIIKENCSGCSACASICPKNCIKLVKDEEGFAYPVYNSDECIRCHLCEKVCPTSNLIQEKEARQYGYAVQNKDQVELKESTSGGAFSALAKYVIDMGGGLVYGVTLDDNLSAMHIGVENIEDLKLLRGSKYVQSYLSPECFREIKVMLKAGRWVLFSGVSCQIEGLVHYLGADFEKLILVDVLCHSVPSPLILKKYIEYQEHKQRSKVTSVRFRDKHYGYTYPTMNVSVEKHKHAYHRGAESDPFLRAFLSGICSRPSCYSCKFRKRYRVSDFTLWDCHNPGRYSKSMDNNCGATNLLIHSEKGKKIFDLISNNMTVVEVDPDFLVKDGAGSMRSLVPNNKNRTQFMRDAAELDGEELFDKWFPITGKHIVKHFMRVTLCNTGIYDPLKRMYVRITKKY